MEKLLNELSILFREMLDNESINLKEETTAADVEEWDSLNHIMLIAEIEKRYKIKFTSTEITKFKNVGEMAGSILSKTTV